MAGSKQVHHWTSGTVYECSEIAGSSHGLNLVEQNQLAYNLFKSNGFVVFSVFFYFNVLAL
jgi:hypothetical protein